MASDYFDDELIDDDDWDMDGLPGGMSRLTAFQRKNIETVAAAIERLEPEQCDMRDWIQRDEPLLPQSQRGTPECGTTACLAGWAALLCAPSETFVGKDWSVPPWLSHNAGQVLVPTTWAIRRKVRIEENLSRSKSLVTVENLGEALLGEDAAQLFVDGPMPYSEQTDQEWMLEQLYTMLMYDDLLRLSEEGKAKR